MRRAFTLTEVIVTLCVMSVLSTVAIPRISALLDSIHVHGASMEVQSLFGVARHVAIARGVQVGVDVDVVQQLLAITLQGDTIRRYNVGREHGVQISATRAHMSYAPTGIGYGAANLSVVVRRNSVVDTVFVSRLGRVRR